MAKGLSHLDKNGVEVMNGDAVRYGDWVGVVDLVEGPIPGSESTRLGLGTLYVYFQDEFRVVRAADVETVPGRAGLRRSVRCADCGEVGERTGHMGCQYPEDH